MPQTSVSNTMRAAFAGMSVNSTRREHESYVSAEASAEMPFGTMLVQGTADSDAKIFAAGTDKMIGILAYSAAYAKPAELGDTGLKPKTTLSVQICGEIWVAVDEAVTPASPVRVRNDANGGAVAGTFRTTASAGHTVDISKFARFLSTTTGAGFARLRFDMTMRNAAVAD